VALGAGLFAAQTQPDQERHLRVRPGFKGDAWVQFRSAYYLYGIIFLIFDVEAVFLLPFAVAFTGLSGAACAAMLVFVLLLVEGLAWAWAKGVLTWA
jgi:NADH-quinone oxidoreductase subunit A